MPLRHHIAALDAALDVLQEADDRNDEDAVWAAVHQVLDQLSRCEERARSANQHSYFRHRDDTVNGRIAGGLLWVRGLIEHHDAEMRGRVFRPFAIAGDDRALQPLVSRPAMGDDARLVFVDDVIWPERQNLPAPGRRYKPHRRDGYYDLLVARQPLMKPLRAARDYFVDDRQ